MYNFAAPILDKVKAVDDFVIPFKGLGVGSHIFNFEIDDSFFESFEYFENITGKVNINVDLLRESNMLIFNFEINGQLNLQCDRCLGSFPHELEGLSKLIVKFSDEFLEESEDVIVISVNENNFDLRHHIFEIVSLLLPVKKVHPTDENGNSTCDSEIIDRINKYSKHEEDPRWDALKGLKFK